MELETRLKFVVLERQNTRAIYSVCSVCWIFLVMITWIWSNAFCDIVPFERRDLYSSFVLDFFCPLWQTELPRCSQTSAFHRSCRQRLPHRGDLRTEEWKPEGELCDLERSFVEIKSISKGTFKKYLILNVIP